MSVSSNTQKTPFPLLYAGPISYYAKYIKNATEFDIHENFTKQTFRSRTRVYGANGVISLSIPVQGGAQNSPINKVRISNIDAWQRIHWRTLVSAYKSSPFFEYYAYLFEPNFLKKYELLLDFNLEMHQTILKCLQFEIEPHLTTEFIPIQKNDLRILYSSKKAHPLSLQFPKYQQVFSYSNPFEPDLSILDALFNLGPETLSYLQNLNL